MQWNSAALISPINFAVREKSDGELTFIGTDAKMYRTGAGKLISINKKCQPPEKFKDWATVTNSNTYTKQLAEKRPVKIKFEEAALASPIGWAYRERTDGKGGFVFVKPVKGHLPLMFSNTKTSKNPREIGWSDDLNEFRDWKPLAEPFGDLLEQASRYPRNLKESKTKVEVQMFLRPTGLLNLTRYFGELSKLLGDSITKVNLSNPNVKEQFECIKKIVDEMEAIL